MRQVSLCFGVPSLCPTTELTAAAVCVHAGPAARTLAWSPVVVPRGCGCAPCALFGRLQLFPRPPRPPRTTLFPMAVPSSGAWGSGRLHVRGSVPLHSLLSLNTEPRFYLFFDTFVTVSKGEAPGNESAWSDHTGMHVVLRRAGLSAVPSPVSGALTLWPVGGARSLLWSLLLCGGSTARLVCRGALQF